MPYKQEFGVRFPDCSLLQIHSKMIGTMSKHLDNLKYVLKHKWFVYIEGRKLGVGVVRLLVHDWQKFTPTEWSAYANKFFAGSSPRRKDGGYDPNKVSYDFDRAWNHHWRYGTHHWQAHLKINTDGTVEAIPMPKKDRLEMVADWCGAGRSINGHGPEEVGKETRNWYNANKDKMILHPETRLWVENYLSQL